MNVQQIIEQKLGASIVEYVNREVSQIPATAGIIAKQDAGRTSLIVVNLGATDAYIAPFPRVSSSLGIFVAAAGGSVRITMEDDYTLPTKAWYGISSAATACLILELVIAKGG